MNALEKVPNVVKNKSHAARCCLILGIAGFSVFIVAILPLSIFAAFFWSGLQFRETAALSSGQQWAAFLGEFFWLFFHRMLFFIVPPALLLWYGIRNRKESIRKPG